MSRFLLKYVLSESEFREPKISPKPCKFAIPTDFPFPPIRHGESARP